MKREDVAAVLREEYARFVDTDSRRRPAVAKGAEMAISAIAHRLGVSLAETPERFGVPDDAAAIIIRHEGGSDLTFKLVFPEGMKMDSEVPMHVAIAMHLLDQARKLGQNGESGPTEE